MKKVSIIVPIYNSENFLNFCIDSLLSQTYKNFEILLIDDGSKDKSLEICKKYSQTDFRIKVFHKENGGVASARNYGLNHSSGEYILFVDSDDYIDSSMIEILVNMIENNKSDFSLCGIKQVNEYNFKSVNKTDDYNCYNICELSGFYSLLINNNNIGGFIGNKLYKRKIIFNLDNFFCGDMFEDYEFNCRYLELCKKISYTEKEMYFYYNNDVSLTRKFSVDKHRINGVEMYNKIISFYDKYDKDDFDLIMFHALKYEFNLNYKSFVISNTSKRKFIDKQKIAVLLKSKKIGFINKIYIYISYCFPILTSKIKYLITKK